MALTLPDPIAGYYAAEAANDFEALARCFTPDGEVRDEGISRQGPAGIAAWMAEAKGRYQHRTEILGASQDGDAYTITVRVSGQFPNSPVDLQQVFRLADGKVRTLEIH